LIFRANTSAYAARVTDFAYSTRIANEDELVIVSKSRPWNAPEHDRDEFTPAQARKMDVFSFGMLCLWVMFEQYLSGVTPLPKEAHWAKKYFHGKGERDLSIEILKDLKQEDKLVMFTGHLLMAEKDLDDDKKHALERLLSASLIRDPNRRVAELKQPLSRLVPSQ
jgi:hypothetical protein